MDRASRRPEPLACQYRRTPNHYAGRSRGWPHMETMALSINAATLRKLIEKVARRVIDHTDELTALDQAIGDGDHGLNMKRGFEAVLADLDQHAAKPLPEALKAIGMALVMKVGGASGPLYGTLFMTLGKELSADPTRDDFA